MRAVHLRHAAPYLLIGLIALLFRLLNLDAFPNSDEINFWLDRSRTFSDALASGRYADTAISTHPGVTTMWLGSAGMLLHRSLMAWDILQSTPFPTELAVIRIPIALTHTGGVLLGYLLLRRMLPFATATLAALLWATDPFTIALCRMLHVDGLMTTFATLSLLAACCSWNGHAEERGKSGYVILSGACAALAILSKSPGLALLPLVAALASAASLRKAHLRSAFASLALWGAALGITTLLVWPATWADPARVVELLRIGVEVEGGTGHVVGNYFLGRPDPEPGILFYPVALALRMTPWAMLGLFLLGTSIVVQWRSGAAGQREHAMQPEATTLAALAGFVILFTVAMSLFPQKLNRYLVPVFPALNIVAAAGLVWGMEWLSGNRGQLTGKRVFNGLLVVCGAVAVLNAAWWHPYTIAYFNQALGGARMGAQTFLVGEGDGLGAVAAWLNAQPDITGVVTASTMINSLRPYMRSGAQVSSPRDNTLSENTGYVVVYIRHTQRGPLAPPFDQFYPVATPLHTVTLHGVEYAWIYQVPPQMEQTADASFGSMSMIQLRGYEGDTSAIRASGILSITLQWQAHTPVPEDYTLFIHLLDNTGAKLGQTDVPPAGPNNPTHTWQPGRAMTWVHPLPVPPDIPAGTYWLSIGLYRPDDFTRLPLQQKRIEQIEQVEQTEVPDDGQHALLLPLVLP